MAAAIIIDKHCDHIPHDRQSKRFAREQSVMIGRKTINNWACLAAKHLAPIADSIKQELYTSDTLQMDETTMKFLDVDKPKAQTGYLWLMRDPKTGAVYYHWHKRRNIDALLSLLDYDPSTEELAFNGTVQCDGYSCYENLSSSYDSILLSACMAHIRRKFMDDVTLQHIPWVKELLDLIKKLYAIERNLRKKNAPPDEAKPIIEQIETLLRDHQPLYRPSDSCFGAIRYALGQWEQLKRYLDNAILPIDNNAIENAVRPCKLGLKNYMFFGSFEGGHNNAILYTLLENCKAVKISIRDYLEYVIEALHHTEASELTPHKVAEMWKLAGAA